MTTIINSPGEKTEDGSGVGLVLGIIVTLILVGLFVFYMLPTLRTTEPNEPSTQIQIDVPTPSANPTPTPAPSAAPTPAPTE